MNFSGGPFLNQVTLVKEDRGETRKLTLVHAPEEEYFTMVNLNKLEMPKDNGGEDLMGNSPARMYNIFFPLSTRIKGVESSNSSLETCVRVAQKIKVVTCMGADVVYVISTYDLNKLVVV